MAAWRERSSPGIVSLGALCGPPLVSVAIGRFLVPVEAQRLRPLRRAKLAAKMAAPRRRAAGGQRPLFRIYPRWAAPHAVSQHAATCCGSPPFISNRGISLRHRSWASGQRG